MRNMYYSDPDNIDLAKMREAASRAAVGDSRTKPEDATIHWHKVDEKCTGHKHEHFAVQLPGL